MNEELIRKSLTEAGIPLRDECKQARGISFAGRSPARDFLSQGGGSVTSESVNAVLVSLGRAIGQVIGNLESPTDAAVAAVDGLLEGIVAELGTVDGEVVLALRRPARFFADCREGQKAGPATRRDGGLDPLPDDP